MQLTRPDYSPSCEGTQSPRPARATREAALDESDVSSNAKSARGQGQEVRARIQSEAGQARKRKSAEIRQAEQSRQWDRQREDIHPVEVLERLASIEAKQTAAAPLPKAIPDPDPERPTRPLRIRQL